MIEFNRDGAIIKANDNFLAPMVHTLAAVKALSAVQRYSVVDK